MIHEENYTVKWHDTDIKNEARPSAVLVFMQETANLQCKANGSPLNQLYFEQHMGFLLSRLAISFDRPIHAYDKIRVQTMTANSHGISFGRCFNVLRDDEIVARAISSWALLNTDTHEMIKVADSPVRLEDEPMIEIPVSLRFRIPSDVCMSEVGTRRVVYSDVDFNGHMNNTRYPDMLCDFLPDANALRVRSMSLSFLREAAYQKEIRIFRGQRDHTFWFRTLNESSEVCLEAEVLTESVDK